MKNKNKYFLSEFIGSCFLVMIIVGSGLMAENLTNDIAVMLIANTLATGAGLFVLITVFADVSGAHFNPFVSIAMTITGKLKKRLLPFYISAQILENVWPNNVNVESRTIDVHIRRLRQSVNTKDKKELIRTVRSSGYSLI